MNFEPPLAVLVDGPDTAMMEFKIHNHHLRRTQNHWRSLPKWVNDLYQRDTRGLSDSLMIAIGITGVPGETCSTGSLNDAFLAFSWSKPWAQSGNGPVLTARAIHADSIRSI